MAEDMAAGWGVPEVGPSLADKNGTFLYNRHNESIFDDVRYFPGLKRDHESVVKFDVANEEYINHATLRALIVQLTSPEVIDYSLICDFFLTYRNFTDSHTVMNLLLTRLIWALQYISSFKPDTEKIGKLVLLRTFVVMRHWILNYFVDDFQPDEALCDHFSFYINQITQVSHLVRANMVFELKIITDLKIHWLSQLNEFYGAAIVVDSPQDVFAHALPQISELAANCKIPKSNTETSIQTNPSVRRSAMLSLYDQKAHHKCLIFDESNANDENPQLSINNLLAQHKSSRASLNDKLRDLKDRKQPPPHMASSTKHKYINLTDSSLALKKTTHHVEKNDKEDDKENVTPVGFSTNGSVKLPSSKVLDISPPTPVKKMDYILRKDLPPTPQDHIIMGDHDESEHKTSLKNIVEGWKRTLYAHEPKVKSESDLPHVDSVKVIGGRVDVLSARIIDELEFLIRNYISGLGTITEDDKDSINQAEIDYSEEAKEPSPRPSNEMSIQDLSELNTDKIDNLFSQDDILVGMNIDEKTFANAESSKTSDKSCEADQSKRSSFGGRVTSINWNDEGNLNLEVSELLEDDNNNMEQDIEDNSFNDNHLIKTSTQELNTSQKEHDPYVLGDPVTPSSSSTPIDIDNYNDEVADLGIALSPQSMLKAVRKISFSEFNTINKQPSSRSRNSSTSQFKRDSLKSYISYDSAFSVSFNNKSATPQESHLKKKHAYNNLRKFTDTPGDGSAEQTYDAFESSSERISAIPFKLNATSNSQTPRSSSSYKRSVRFSTLCALTELPFNNYRECSIFIVKSNSEVDKSRKLSDIADSSVFSCMITGRKSTIESMQKSSDQSSTTSVAIPGISNNVLKELAAIPDESFSSSNNPVQSALHRLEGKNFNTNMTLSRSEPANLRVDRLAQDKSSAESLFGKMHKSAMPVGDLYFNNTDDILDEINNAATQDVIEYSLDVEQELKEKPVTPIKKKSLSVMQSASTSNISAMLMGMPNRENTSQFSILNPKLVLDRYALTSSALSIENVVQNGTHISFVLSCSSKSLAEHFTIIEKDILQEIDWKELIELQWNKELTPMNSWLEIIVNDSYYSKNRGVNLVIARFNLMVNWVISEILLTQTEEEQIAIISRFIHVAQHCLSIQNFSTLMQIVLALTSEKVAKLKSTWKNLPPGDILTLKSLEELTAPNNNFIRIRVCTNLLQPSLGCIPFVGLYLSDLVFNAERPKFVKNPNAPKDTSLFMPPETSVLTESVAVCQTPPLPAEDSFITEDIEPVLSMPPPRLVESSCSTPTLTETPVLPSNAGEGAFSISDSISSSETSGETDKLINFSRFRTSVHIVKSLLQCIEWSKNYHFSVNDEVLRKCLYIKSLDEDEMNYCLEAMHV